MLYIVIMKNYAIVLLAAAALFAGCEKEIVQPKSTTVTYPVSLEKSNRDTKSKNYCEVRDLGTNTVLAQGTKCTGTGDECGRKSYCTAQLGFTEDPDQVIFENLTRQQFIELWNTEDGRIYLTSKGVYETDKP